MEDVVKAGVNVSFDKYTWMTRSPAENDGWDRGTTESVVNDVKVNLTKDYPDLVIPFVPVKGTTYYLVYVVYSTGDSFGYDEGETQPIGVFETSEEANTAVNAIRQHYGWYKQAKSWRAEDKKAVPKNFSAHSVQIHNKHLSDLVCTYWIGYFESLTDVVIRPITIGNIDIIKEIQCNIY